MAWEFLSASFLFFCFLCTSFFYTAIFDGHGVHSSGALPYVTA